MKTITTLIGILFLGGITFANSTLNLVINGGNLYTVYLDGQEYQTSSTIFFQDLFPGRHTLSVVNKGVYHPTSVYNGYIDVLDNQTLYGTLINGTLKLTKKNMSYGHNDCSQNNNYNQHLNSNSHYGMNNYVFHQLHNDIKSATDARKTRLLIQKSQQHGISTSQARRLLSDFSFDSHRLSAAKQLTAFVVDRNNYWTVGETFTFSSNKKAFLRHLNNGSYNHNSNNTNHHDYNSYGMNQQAFQVLKRMIREESFDNNRKQQVLTAVRYGEISSQQMTQLLKEFTFDSNRLATAKSVIPYITDKENYWMAGETFTFSSNKNNFLKALN